MVTVEVPLAPCATETAVDGAVSVKAGVGGGGPDDPEPEEPQPLKPIATAAAAAKTTNVARKLPFIIATSTRGREPGNLQDCPIPPQSRIIPLCAAPRE